MVHVRASPPVGAALGQAIDGLRGELAEPHAAIAVVAPMRANAQLAQRALVDVGSYIRIAFETPDALVTRIGRFALLDGGALPEPAGWLEATLAERVPALADAGALGPHGETLRRPIWIPTLVEAIHTLERGGVDHALLAGIDDDLAAHARLLATISSEVHSARAADGLVDARAIASAALHAIETDRLPQSARFSGFVVLGDGVLGHGIFVALGALFARFPTRRLALDPFERIAPAPLGLRLAAAGAPTIRVETPGDDALAHVRGHLFAPTLEAGPGDESVVMAATPDEVREVGEAIRVVQRAIAGGSALERIAIALPDATQAHVLEDALARAHLPATWLVGPPLARSTPARFIALALALTAPQPTAHTWYELIRHPGVLAAMRAGGYEVHGSTRWRQLLSTSGAVRGTRHIIDALAERGDDNADPIEATACRSLRAAIERFAGELAALPATGRLSEYARALLRLTTAYQPPSTARAQLERLLREWGAGDVGPRLGRASVATLLADTLESTQILRGALTDRAVCVAPPMALLGGDFDVVCVLGLTEGRFPAAVREHPLVPDRLIAAVNARCGGLRLAPSGHLADAERRRFAAAVASARDALWLSAPRSDLLEARPAVPSALLLDVASTCAGARATYSALASMLVSAGGRDVFAPDDPDDATNAVEHLLATSRSDPAAGLAALASHPWARRLLRLYRAIDRYHHPAEGRDPVLDAWSGLVDPSLVAHVEHGDGAESIRANLADASVTSLAPDKLAQAIVSPTEYFFRQVLGAFRPSWLGGRNAPTDTWTVAHWVKEAVEATLETPGGDLDASFASAWDRVAADALRHRPPEDHEEAKAARELALGLWDKIRDDVAAQAAAVRQPLDGMPIADDLAWRLRGTSGHVVADTLHAWDEESQPARKHPHKLVALGLQVLALELAGAPVRKPVLWGVDHTKDAGRGWSVDGARARARDAFARIAEGRWPIAGGELRLHREPAKEASS